MLRNLTQGLSNRSIASKLLASFVVIALVLLAVVIADAFTERQEDQALEDLLQAQRKIELSQQLQETMNKVGFDQNGAIVFALINRPEQATENFEEMSVSLDRAFAIVDSMEGSGGEAAIIDSESAAALRTPLENMVTGGEDIMALYTEERGTGDEWRQLELVALATQIYDLTAQDETLAQDGFQLHLAARGYVFGTYPDTLTLFNSAISNLQRNLDESELSASDKTALSDLLTEATQVFQRMVAADLGIVASGIALRGNYDDVAHQALLLVDDAYRERDAARDNLDRVQEMGTIIQAALVISVLLISLGLTMVVSSNIAAPIQKLERATRRIAAGAYDERISVERRDEVGQLARLFNRMAEAVQTRERDLAASADSLKKTNEQLREAGLLKDQFLSTMSHELRTPLNAIIGYTGLLQMGIGGAIDDEARDKIASIEQSGELLLALINDILDISKIEAGRLEIVSNPIELKGMIATWARQIQVMAKKKNLTFEQHVGDGLPDIIQGDSDRLTQIAMNLLSNAVKFTDEGTVTLNVSKKNAAVNPVWVMEVTDTGRGISSEALEYVFDEFRQVDGSYSREFGGTGLGLSIVRRLVKLMGGSVAVKSTLGSGSTFTVELPLRTYVREPETQI